MKEHTDTPGALRTVVIEREFPWPPEKLWRALTEGALIKEWLMDNDFQPVAGHKFVFRSTAVGSWNGVINGEVLVIEPHKKLCYTWGALGLESRVTWTLVERNGATLLRMEHSGFAPNQNAAYNGAKYGWQKFIGNLERIVGAIQ